MSERKIPSKNQIRTLKQYQGMSEEELDKAYDDLIYDRKVLNNLEERIQKKLSDFEEQYDTSDMKLNDREGLYELMKAYITLEDMNEASYRLRVQPELTEYDMSRLEKITKIISTIRTDISKLQDDLHISRRVRKGEKEESVLSYIEKLREKAKEYTNAKFGRVYCPNCKMLVGSVWALYPESKKNKVTFHCNRRLADESICDTVIQVSYKDLLDNGMKNIDDVLEF